MGTAVGDATAIVRRRVSLQDFTEDAIRDPELSMIARRVTTRVDPGKDALPMLYPPADVTIETVDGRVSSLGADSLALSIGTVEFHLRVDGSGRVLGGCIPAQGVVVDRLGS